MKRKTSAASKRRMRKMAALFVAKPAFLLSLVFLAFSYLAQHSGASTNTDPVPAAWPLQFHSILYVKGNESLQIIDLWYDWPNGRNFNIIQNQLGELLYDLEWNNGTSYYYTLDANRKCSSIHFPVGILRPNWLEGAEYLGQQYMDKFLCNVWTKVDFIWYYEDVASKRPVAWKFFTGMTSHVITFEVGKVLDDPKWQAPPYCFKDPKPNYDELYLSKRSTFGHSEARVISVPNKLKSFVDNSIFDAAVVRMYFYFWKESMRQS